MTFNLLSPEATVYANVIIAETKFETPSERMKLNNMGVDLSYWRDVKVILKNQVASIFIDNEQIFESTYKGTLGELTGVQFYIKGRGAVDCQGIET
jgi:hypothetical protein